MRNKNLIAFIEEEGVIHSDGHDVNINATCNRKKQYQYFFENMENT